MRISKNSNSKSVRIILQYVPDFFLGKFLVIRDNLSFVSRISLTPSHYSQEWRGYRAVYFTSPQCFLIRWLNNFGDFMSFEWLVF